MGFLDKVEKSIEGAVSGVFARAFRGEVEPVEIAGRLQRELEVTRTAAREAVAVTHRQYRRDLVPLSQLPVPTRTTRRPPHGNGGTR